MRILYISPAERPDYLCDMVFHGLRSEWGPDVVDVDRVWYMYADEFGEGRHDRSQLYGRGLTLFGLLPPDTGVDRTDIEQKIRTRYFDFIVYGSIHRSARYIRDVLLTYPPERILFVDGEDFPTIITQLLGMGIYFKRELQAAVPGVTPIQFAIPEERIGTIACQKTKVQAFVDPRDPRTYIYHDEAGYYGDYAQSLFGVTMKKAGWDCLRHYEIMANGCIPWFLDLDLCPAQTMTFLPKFELLFIKKLIETRGPEFFETQEGLDNWVVVQKRIDAAFRQHGTTRALAKYVIDTACALKPAPLESAALAATCSL